MAFDTLRPHASQITGLISQGRTLAQITDILASQHGVETTPATLSRFASSLKPARHKTAPSADPAPTVNPSPEPLARPLPELTPAQHLQVDVIALFTELHSEFRALRDESRQSLGHLSGKVAALTADVTELETVAVQHMDGLKGDLTRLADLAGKQAPPSIKSPKLSAPIVPGRVVLGIWLRAFVFVTLFWAIVIAVLWWVKPVASLS